MKTNTFILAALASVFAVTAVAPSFAAGKSHKDDPVRKEKRLERMIERTDTDGDKRVSPQEFATAIGATFAVIDTNKDGVLSREEIDNRRETFKAHREQLKAEGKTRDDGPRMARLPRGLGKNFEKIDANGDGSLSKAEIDAVAEKIFARRDRNKDGFISVEDAKV